MSLETQVFFYIFHANAFYGTLFLKSVSDVLCFLFSPRCTSFVVIHRTSHSHSLFEFQEHYVFNMCNERIEYFHFVQFNLDKRHLGGIIIQKLFHQMK